MKCPICNKEYNGIIGLSTHLAKVHKWNRNDIYMYCHYTINNIEIPKCKICSNNVIFTGRRILNTCGCKECESKYRSIVQLNNYDNHPEWRDRARNNRLKYLLNNQNFINTAWGKRANRELSYLENWFIENIILPNNLQEKYDIINDYSVNPYFLDFAFINIKLDVELDGKCHFENGKQRIQHDIDRDNYLLNNGWKIFRISYLDNNEDTIKQFIDYLNTEIFEYNQKYYDNIILKGSEVYSKKLNKQKEQRLKNKEEKINNIKLILSNLKNLDIDYSKFGWVEQVKKYLIENNIELKGNISRYINKYYPEFFEEVHPFIRK